MDTRDDHQLLAAAGRGDHVAMEALIWRHGPQVLSACRRQVPGADADDAAQAVFLVLWRRTAVAAQAPSLPGWLAVTARRVCANARRSAQRRQHAERSLPPPVAAVPGNDARDLLDEAIASLPSGERDVVVRRHLLGEEPATVAAVPGCAEGTVHSRTSRDLDRLRGWFARRGIVCTSAGLLALCDQECASAQAVEPTTVLSTPSATAQQLAAASTPAVLWLVLRRGDATRGRGSIQELHQPLGLM